MQPVKVSRSKLISILEENKAKHKEVVAEATEEFKRKQSELWIKHSEVLQKLGTRLQTEDELVDLIELQRMQSASGNFKQLPVPQDNTEEYDRVIGMLQMATENEVELTIEDYARYVEDKWDWKRSWALHNSIYTTKALDY